MLYLAALEESLTRKEPALPLRCAGAPRALESPRFQNRARTQNETNNRLSNEAYLEHLIATSL